jgi:hypothetical protein
MGDVEELAVMGTRTPPAALPVRACTVCDEPLAPRARATTTLCRVCLTKKAQADFLIRLAVNQRINRHRPNRNRG